MSCSIGLGDSPTCSEERLGKEYFTPMEWKLILIRSRCSSAISVCLNHKKKFLEFFSLKHDKCCDPQKVHSTKATGVHVILLVDYLKAQKVEWECLDRILPGFQLCKRCYFKFLDIIKDAVFSEKNSEKSTSTPSDSQEIDYVQAMISAAGSVQNAILEVELQNIEQNTPSDGGPQPGLEQQQQLEVSRDLFSDEDDNGEGSSQESQVEGEGTMVSGTSQNASQSVPGTISGSTSQKGGGDLGQTVEKVFYDSTIADLKETFKNSSTTRDKMAVISIALVSMTHRKVLEEFGPCGATDHMLKKTAKLVSEQGLLPIPHKKRGRGLKDETVTLVKIFFEDDEISSRQMPGKRDYVSVKEGNVRVHKQKRLVLCTLKELHAHFKERYPTDKHCVLASASGTHSVCVCKYHQNFKLLIEGDNFCQFDNNLNTFTDFISAIICEEPTPECYFNRSSKCPGTESLENKLREFLNDNLVDNITYQQWTSTDRCSLETFMKEYDDFLAMFFEQLKTLLTHHFISKEQSRYFKSVKEDLKDGKLHFYCPVQSYYWANDQVTIHPFVCYFKENGELKSLSYATISEHMKHVINEVYEFQRHLMDFLKVKLSEITKVVYFSDGAAQQYKNKKNVINVSYHEEDFGVKAEWHYFATSHGKGPCDGLAGTMKRQAYLSSIRGHLIRTPLEFFNWADKHMPNIHGKFVSSEEILKTKENLKEQFARSLSIPQIRSQHGTLPKCPSEVFTKPHSFSCIKYFFAL
ncbi:ARL14 effector protein [Frankliniella fusca]|uniref:ARL14 effector protein n=1 Tax=Frankliniella fusca TaxID=407009 RepID=A0AAE1HEJ5_9NEOP|nr:ARL14 effector protein [Frankliniella fusca]